MRHKIASLDQLDNLRRATKDGLTIRPVLSDYIFTDGTHEEQPDQHINNDGTITFTFRFTTEPAEHQAPPTSRPQVCVCEAKTRR